MPKIKDLRGKIFGELIVLNENPIRINNATYWKCKCNCGTEKNIFAGNLVSNKTTSCGCKKQKTQFPRLRRILDNMKQRCYNPNHTRYKDYGSRGITICDDWLNDSRKFYEWAVINGYNDNLTIDRINVNGNYEPKNCRWVTMKVQQNNRNNNRKITVNGKTKTASQWAEEYSLTRDGFLYRYKHNLLN